MFVLCTIQLSYFLDHCYNFVKTMKIQDVSQNFINIISLKKYSKRLEPIPCYPFFIQGYPNWSEKIGNIWNDFTEKNCPSKSYKNSIKINSRNDLAPNGPDCAARAFRNAFQNKRKAFRLSGKKAKFYRYSAPAFKHDYFVGNL